MYIQFLLFTLRIYFVLCCDPRCKCRDTSVSCLTHDSKLDAIPSDIPPSTTYLFMGIQNLRNLNSLECSRLPNLQRLILRDNLLEHLGASDFQGCTVVDDLILTRNKISAIDNKTFNELPSLESLNLDENLMTNLRFLMTVSTNLRSLTIEKNHITSLPVGTFDRFINLCHLHLNGNLIKRIDHSTFSKVPTCALHLSGNMISDLSFLQHLHANLYYISLSNISISKLENDTFRGMVKLRYIYLQHNSLDKIPPGLFDDTNIYELNMANNKLTEIDYRVFAGLSNLNNIDMANNKITEINNRVFAGLSNLNELKLGHNSIATIADGSFKDTRLSELDLQSNKLTVINSGMFEGLTDLWFINLNGNNITHITSDAFRNLRRTYLSLDLDNNPVSCSSQTRPRPIFNLTFEQWMQTSHDVRGPQDACLFLPRYHFQENADSIEVRFFIGFEGTVNGHNCSPPCGKTFIFYMTLLGLCIVIT